eukprot:scaffold43066_cov67-Phaeocystis_antarctica.AAC.4
MHRACIQVSRSSTSRARNPTRTTPQHRPAAPPPPRAGRARGPPAYKCWLLHMGLVLVGWGRDGVQFSISVSALEQRWSKLCAGGGMGRPRSRKSWPRRAHAPGQCQGQGHWGRGEHRGRRGTVSYIVGWWEIL